MGRSYKTNNKYQEPNDYSRDDVKRERFRRDRDERRERRYSSRQEIYEEQEVPVLQDAEQS